MSAPAAVDLSLPADRELLAAASPDPEVEAERVTRTGNPGRIHGIGQELVAAGVTLDEVYGTSRRAQGELAGGFTNDGAPVYDEGLHGRRLPSGFRQAGTSLHDAGRRLGVVADELAAAIGEVNGALDRLRADLNRRRSEFAAQVDAARVADGLVPVEAVGGLLARRERVAAQMQDAVSACGRDVSARVGRYDEILGGCLPLLGELGRVGAGVDRRGLQPHPLVDGRLAASSPAPAGPAAEIFPIPDPQPREPGFRPVPAGPGPLITLPAPGLGTGFQDGPGSGQRVDGPGLHVDRQGDRPDDGDPTPRIHPGQQGKHIPGHPNYQPGKGRITVDPEELIGRVGTGEQVGTVPRGEAGFKERIDYHRIIGEHIDEDTGYSIPTSIGIVHHRIDGSVHIVPGRPPR